LRLFSFILAASGRSRSHTRFAPIRLNLRFLDFNVSKNTCWGNGNVEFIYNDTGIQ